MQKALMDDRLAKSKSDRWVVVAWVGLALGIAVVLIAWYLNLIVD